MFLVFNNIPQVAVIYRSNLGIFQPLNQSVNRNNFILVCWLN